jgi:hypothetical protein
MITSEATSVLTGLPLKSSSKGPVWLGPCNSSPQGGVTQSLLGRFLCCRERFRLLVIEGLKPAERWNHKIGYGNFWHVCEENLAKGGKYSGGWIAALDEYTKAELEANPLDREVIEHWYCVCRTQFPHYVKYWSNQPDVVGRTPIMQEEKFCVPYTLPSGRTVYLRGKYDAVDLIRTNYRGVNIEGVYHQENKTKGDLDREQIIRQLSFDLQTLFYLVALDEQQKNGQLSSRVPIKGVRFNCVRRPLSGGKHTIVQHQPTKGAKCPKCKETGVDPKVGEICPKCDGQQRIGAKPGETRDHFYERVGELIASDPDWFFMRFTVDITKADVDKFKQECLDPTLEQLCDWWEWIQSGDPWRCGNTLHTRTAFGIYNPMLEGRQSDLDEYLSTGSTVGLKRVHDLFPELK